MIVTVPNYSQKNDQALNGTTRVNCSMISQEQRQRYQFFARNVVQLEHNKLQQTNIFFLYTIKVKV